MRLYPALLSALVSSACIAQVGGQPATTPKPSTPVTVTNDVTAPVPVVGVGPIQTVITIPYQQFSTPPQAVTAEPTGSDRIAPAGSLNQFAISSVVVTNDDDIAHTVILAVHPISVRSQTCATAMDTSVEAPGPRIRVPSNNTTVINFMKPYATGGIAAPGMDLSPICLTAKGDGGPKVTWSVVGYIPPVGSVVSAPGPTGPK